jgi:hypothetical protein
MIPVNLHNVDLFFSVVLMDYLYDRSMYGKERQQEGKQSESGVQVGESPQNQQVAKDAPYHEKSTKQY